MPVRCVSCKTAPTAPSCEPQRRAHPAQHASPLTRPYDIRHAAVSLWLNSGVPATEVARHAGHGGAQAVPEPYHVPCPDLLVADSQLPKWT